MVKKKFKWMSIFVMSFIFLVVLAACSGGSEESSSDSESGSSSDSSGTESTTDEGAKSITVGSLYDMTGATSDTGTPYAEGQEHYFEYLTSKGGVDGLDIQHIGTDYAYEISEAQRVYQQYRDRDNVSAILGWGTGDTEALRQQIAADKIPFMSASYSENLKNIDESPYNFFVAASYSDQGRMILEWIQDNHSGDNPTVALLYNDTGFGRSPIEDIKSYAEEIGIEIVDEQIIDLGATEAQSQLLNMEKTNPDYAIIQQTWGATTTILRDAKTLGIDTQFIGLNQAAGEGLIEQAGDIADGFIGILTHALPSEDVPGMEEYKEYLDSAGMSIDDINMQHVAGWVVAKVMVEGIKNAAAATDGEMTGEDVLAGLEAIENLDLGGLAAPVTFTSDLHAGTEQARLGQVVNGKWEPITDFFSYKD